MKKSVVSFWVGFLFAIGLGISGMTNPKKVLGFLDIFGTWDSSLLFVMMGAISVHAIAYLLIKKRKTPVLDLKFHIPTRKDISLNLILGAIIFGAGWGLAGYCPGPVIASLPTANTGVITFFVSMIAGMITYKLFENKINGSQGSV